MNRRVLASALALTVGLGAVAALAASKPADDGTAAYAEARLRSLRVLAGARVTEREADLRGAWLDGAVACTVDRRLGVSVLVDAAATGGKHHRVRRGGSFLAPNCAEGGPNVGFTLTARRIGLACPDGRWRPGRYSFTTTTREPTRALRATASLVWTTARRC
ncbi:MAG TPA: hypothetical protein VLB86_10000 [Gaiellaceae bacterium]|nr:hypothetical protein [Gaiellaceae bacterium]